MFNTSNVPADQKPWPEIKKLLENRIVGCADALTILENFLKNETDDTKKEEINKLIEKIHVKKDVLSEELKARNSLNDIASRKNELSQLHKLEYERYNTIKKNIERAKEYRIRCYRNRNALDKLDDYIQKANIEKRNAQSLLEPVKLEWDELREKQEIENNKIGSLLKKNPQMYKSADKIGDPCTACIAMQIAPYSISATDDAEMGEKDNAAIKEAIKLVDDAINRLEKAKEKSDTIVNKYFSISGTSEEDKKNLDNIIGKYKKIQKTLKAGVPDGFKIKHLKLFGDKSNTNAFVSGFNSGDDAKNKTVFTSKDNFYDSSKDDTKRGAIILHELSHGVAETDDIAYDWQAKFKTLTSEESQKNADSFEEFSISSLKETELQNSNATKP